LPENPRALFNCLWATTPAKLHRIIGEIAARHSQAHHERAFASRSGRGLSVDVSSCVVRARLLPRARPPAIRA
jgi:hypothetical protein